MISKKLKEMNIEIVSNDIQYQEGILEYLEKNKNINFLIINEIIPGNFEIKDLVYKIKKINKKVKIIIISEKEQIMGALKVLKRPNVKEIVNIINNENVFNKKYIPIREVFNENTKDGEVTTILGTNGIGKSIFSIVFANQIKNKKILIIDFDVLNNNIHTLLGVNEYSKKIKDELKNKDFYSSPIDIHDFIIHTKFNIDLISGIDIIFNSKKNPTISRIRNLVLSVKKEYDLILIDTSSESLLDYTKELVKIANNAIFISGANMLEIRKTEKLLKIYNREWRVPNNKINIIFNKCTNKSISDEILRDVFRKYNILGKIQLSDYYDLAVNKNNAKIPQIEKDILNIKNNYKQTKNKRLKINRIKNKK